MQYGKLWKPSAGDVVTYIYVLVSQNDHHYFSIFLNFQFYIFPVFVFILRVYMCLFFVFFFF